MPKYEVRFMLPGTRCPGERPSNFIKRHQGDVVCRIVASSHEMEGGRFWPIFQMGLLFSASTLPEAWSWAGEHLSRMIIRPGEFFAVVYPERVPQTMSEYLCDMPEYAALWNK